MAVTFGAGFEAQQAVTDGVTLLGTSSYSLVQANTGVASIRCNPASGASGYFSAVGFNPTSLGFAIYIATAPSVARRIVGQASDCALRLNADRTVIDHEQS